MYALCRFLALACVLCLSIPAKAESPLEPDKTTFDFRLDPDSRCFYRVKAGDIWVKLSSVPDKDGWIRLKSPVLEPGTTYSYEFRIEGKLRNVTFSVTFQRGQVVKMDFMTPTDEKKN